MLVCLGGFRGSGRKYLAKQLSKRHGLHYYDTTTKKSHKLRFKRDGSVKQQLNNPATDEYRTHVYSRVLADFQLVSTMHSDVVLEETFHRNGPRNFFLTEAAKYFKPVIFIWIECDESLVVSHLEILKEKRIIGSIKKSLKRRERAKKEFDGLPPSTPLFDCKRIDGSEVERLWSFIQELRIEKGATEVAPSIGAV
jgi:hypothetical protein